MGTFSLIPQVADHLKIPLVAAGGIADGRGIAAAMTLGANGVQIGTAFLACRQSNASLSHKAKILSAATNKTTLTKSFTGRLARGIAGEISTKLKQHEDEFAPYPLQSIFMHQLKKAAIKQSRFDMLTFWAGQSFPLVKHNDAEVLFMELLKQTESLIKGKE